MTAKQEIASAVSCFIYSLHSHFSSQKFWTYVPFGDSQPKRKNGRHSDVVPVLVVLLTSYFAKLLPSKKGFAMFYEVGELGVVGERSPVP